MKAIAVLLAVIFLALFALLSAGCAIDPKARGYAERIRDHDGAIYATSNGLATLADRRAYADPATRPYVDPAIIDNHRDSMREARAVQDEFIRFARPVKLPPAATPAE